MTCSCRSTYRQNVDRIAQARVGDGFDESRRQIEAGSAFLAGGVSSNFRLGVAPTPLVIERAEGAVVVDADGNRLIDYYAAMGPMILGHSPEPVRRAAAAQLERGILYGGTSALEAEAARLVCECVPCAELVRFGSSGSEAVQAALRLARAATGRDTVVKFEGHYHGWFDNVLWSTAPPPGANGPVKGSRGQPDDAGAHLAVLPWNDAAALEARLARGDVAAVIMEAAMCNAGAIAPLPGYLERARAACNASGTVLIFDEVITGFRLGLGGAQGRFGVTPDLAVFAKALANGFPVAAVAGRRDLMMQVAEGVLHGGTYNGQAVCMAACVATLNELRRPGFYDATERRGRRLMDGIRDALAAAGVRAVVAGFPTIFHVGWGLSEPARNWSDFSGLDRAGYVRFTTALLRCGVRALERGAWFVSAAHDDTHIDRTLDAVAAAAGEV
ncbi:MAG: aminotransferase class III-fold pyridoxal phosphate-dependent enzyme [Acidisphaera sp.]|nr:aminotransferase class III-fold pyridoxal phosphate-dependent enzyme [Acidisphaera sp.]